MSQYIITNFDKTRFIFRNRTGRYVPTTCEALADLFGRKQAESIYMNSLSKALKTVFHVEKYDTPPEQVKQVTQADLVSNTEKVMMADNIQKWIDKVSDLNGLAKDAIRRKNELNEQLRVVDQELCDCLHYVEFCNLNAAQGYKAYVMIKNRRIRRRSIKNELEVINIILGKKINESITDEIISSVKGLDKRTYEPRVLKELFDI